MGKEKALVCANRKRTGSHRMRCTWGRNMLDDDDISTERLFALVCDECHCDVDDVINALMQAGRLKEK